MHGRVQTWEWDSKQNTHGWSSANHIEFAFTNGCKIVSQGILKGSSGTEFRCLQYAQYERGLPLLLHPDIDIQFTKCEVWDPHLLLLDHHNIKIHHKLLRRHRYSLPTPTQLTLIQSCPDVAKVAKVSESESWPGFRLCFGDISHHGELSGEEPSVTARFFVTTFKASQNPFVALYIIHALYSTHVILVGYSSSCPPWWCQAYLRPHLRRDPWRPEDFLGECMFPAYLVFILHSSDPVTRNRSFVILSLTPSTPRGESSFPTSGLWNLYSAPVLCL